MTVSDLDEGEIRWHEWVARACEAVGIDSQTVDIKAIHGLTKRVAHNLDRPLAPVSSYILGVAVGMAAAAGEATAQQRSVLMDRLLTVVPKGGKDT
ncbi:DUF6457 domain-containing protein [Cumulibacter manganitolerans]|uniref:DUF6457 domain-containing protein n=1 Tax=Cumulibacter manganitolerans TaxID=1884992 RepID=UPI001297893F|nr:DUF6457 domain-containing protein [Cumulibacter manganitolerans]